MRLLLIEVMVAAVLSGCGAHGSPVTTTPTTETPSRDVFRSRMEALAAAWNAGDAQRAADCFTEDAVYSSPPTRERKGRTTLFEYFGGQRGRPRAMKMQWHHLVFDPATQVGAGEYTFEYEMRTHGVVMIKLVGGKIARWREYEIESPLDWEKLAGESLF